VRAPATTAYERPPAGFTLMPFLCLKNDRNPIDAEGCITAQIAMEAKPQ
jgi:hypothetical protein